MRVVYPALLAFATLEVVALNLDSASFSPEDVIRRDVAVIGGGSTGTYTAWRLGEQNYSIAIIEPKHTLGGNAETFTASNGWTIDYGVIVFANITSVTDYFTRFNVSLVPLDYSSAPPLYIDFSTGQTVDYTPPEQSAVAEGLTQYAAQLAKYPEIDSGFNLTYPIASDSDLLLPFGEFVAKYNLSAIMRLTFVTNQGYAPLLNITTLYMLKYLNAGQLQSYATNFLTTKNHDIQQLYTNVAAYLGADNVFVNSTVIGMDRSCSPARIMIQTPTGRKLILAKKVLITAAPTLDNLKDIDLLPQETSLFSQFFANGYYTGILTNTSFTGNFSSQNVGLDPANYNIPTLPGLYTMTGNPGAPGYTQVYYGSPTVEPPEQVQADIVATIARVQQAQGMPLTKPEWQVFSAHTPFNLMVSPKAIQDGFYEKLYALQGQNGTFWNGAAWETQDSSWLWRFTEQWILPKIVASLHEA